MIQYYATQKCGRQSVYDFGCQRLVVVDAHVTSNHYTNSRANNYYDCHSVFVQFVGLAAPMSMSTQTDGNGTIGALIWFGMKGPHAAAAAAAANSLWRILGMPHVSQITIKDFCAQCVCVCVGICVEV